MACHGCAMVFKIDERNRIMLACNILYVMQCKSCKFWFAEYSQEAKNQKCPYCFQQKIKHTATINPKIVLSRILNGIPGAVEECKGEDK